MDVFFLNTIEIIITGDMSVLDEDNFAVVHSAFESDGGLAKLSPLVVFTQLPMEEIFFSLVGLVFASVLSKLSSHFTFTGFVKMLDTLACCSVLTLSYLRNASIVRFS